LGGRRSPGSPNPNPNAVARAAARRHRLARGRTGWDVRLAERLQLFVAIHWYSGERDLSGSKQLHPSAATPCPLLERISRFRYGLQRVTLHLADPRRRRARQLHLRGQLASRDRFGRPNALYGDGAANPHSHLYGNADSADGNADSADGNADSADGNADSADANTDSTDGNGDSADANADRDAGLDEHADANPDLDTDADFDLDTDADFDLDADADFDLDADADFDLDANANPDLDADADPTNRNRLPHAGARNGDNRTNSGTRARRNPDPDANRNCHANRDGRTERHGKSDVNVQSIRDGRRHRQPVTFANSPDKDTQVDVHRDPGGGGRARGPAVANANAKAYPCPGATT
jgi:hypothetical protein